MPTKRIAPPLPSRLNVKTKTIPISRRKKKIRTGSPIKYQKAIFSKFMTDKISQRHEKAFANWFEIICKLDTWNSDLDKAISEFHKTYFMKSIRRLDTKIKPAKKRIDFDSRRPISAKRLESRRQINAKCLEYFRQNGAPKNIRDFIKWLSEEGVLTRTNKWDRPFKLSETTVRDILRNTFKIRGKPGRKPG